MRLPVRAALASLLLPALAQAAPLPAYRVQPGEVAAAGFSAGGFMAVQLHIARSSLFKRGVAVFAGGPYRCAEGSSSTAYTTCLLGLGGGPDPADSIAAIDAAARAGDIDATSNLNGSRAWLFTGTLDSTVSPSTVRALATAYTHHLGASNVTLTDTVAAGHGWISPDGLSSCSTTSTPYVNSCTTDVEQGFLTTLFGPLQPKGTASATRVRFDQAEFLDDRDPETHGMASTGVLYAPAACTAGTACKVLVVLHGCAQAESDVGTAFVDRSGLLGWAESNNLLLLFPQAHTSFGNLTGCWDWWGHDDVNHAKRTGRQLQAIARMVERLGQGTSGSASSSGSSSGSSAGATSSGSTGSASTGATSSGSGSSGSGTASSNTSSGSASGSSSGAASTGTASGSSGAATAGAAASSSGTSASGFNNRNPSTSSSGCSSAAGGGAASMVLALSALLGRRRRRG